MKEESKDKGPTESKVDPYAAHSNENSAENKIAEPKLKWINWWVRFWILMGFPELLVFFQLIRLACVKIVTVTPQYPKFAKFPDMDEISYSK